MHTDDTAYMRCSRPPTTVPCVEQGKRAVTATCGDGIKTDDSAAAASRCYSVLYSPPWHRTGCLFFSSIASRATYMPRYIHHITRPVCLLIAPRTILGATRVLGLQCIGLTGGTQALASRLAHRGRPREPVTVATSSPARPATTSTSPTQRRRGWAYSISNETDAGLGTSPGVAAAQPLRHPCFCTMPRLVVPLKALALPKGDYHHSTLCSRRAQVEASRASCSTWIGETDKSRGSSPPTSCPRSERSRRGRRTIRAWWCLDRQVVRWPRVLPVLTRGPA